MNSDWQKPIWISFSTCDEEGQVENGVALEAKSMNIYGFTNEGLLIDIHHLDDEQERIVLSGEKYGDLTFGAHERIMAIRVLANYPATNPISKVEFRERFGAGKLLNERGHFA